jgi:hypothetical protein
MEDMENKFSWTELFLVTSLCFFLFSLYLKFIEVENPGIFLWVAIGSLGLGILSSAFRIVASAGKKQAD